MAPKSKSAVVIAPCAWDTLWTEQKGLFEQHWKEMGRPRSLRFKPDDLRYRALEQRGVLLCLSVRLDEQLVGYSVTVISPHLHCSDTVVAQVDAIFVTKAARGAGIGLRLLRETERASKDAGAEIVFVHAKPGTPLEELLPRTGHGLLEMAFMKELA